MESILVFVLWIRERYVPEIHDRIIDSWDEKWYIHCISEDEEGIRETAEDTEPKWETKIESYPMNTLLYRRAFDG